MHDALSLQNRHTGETLLIRRVRDAAGQAILTIDGTLPAGAKGPPPHIHFNIREEIVVKAGTLGASVGKKTLTLSAGESAVFPAGVVHAWGNAGDDLLELSGRVVPAGDLDRFLQAVLAVLNASTSGTPSIFYIAHVLRRHRQTHLMMTPPRAVQAIVFPLILLIGTVLGKYRGTNWPGSPESCPGAPEVGATR